MKMQKVLSAGVMSLGLVVGLSGFAGAEAGSTSTIHNTGWNSYNAVSQHMKHTVAVKNTNNLHASNSNYQTAYTGNVGVHYNTTVGNVSTGMAQNMNTTNVSATVNNTPSVAAVAPAVSSAPVSAPTISTVENTGPSSTNTISSTDMSKVTVDNTNNLSVTNSTSQDAESGSVNVKDNTTVGSVTTGDASNTNSTSVSFNLTN